MTNKNSQTYIDYAKKCFKSFEELPFNEVDSAIFSQLSYLLPPESEDDYFSFKRKPLIELLHAEYYDELLKGVYEPEETLDLLVAVLANPRYRDAYIEYYRNKNDLDISLQFSAMVISFNNLFHYVVYRGTDKTVHGWKEDFMLLMSKAAPCQAMAVEYLNKVGALLDGVLVVGGHSKGGNLAVYASAHCDKIIQDRILEIFSHDGPGFLNSELEYPGMKEIKSRITKQIPTSSLVGLILQNETEPKYIKSNNIGPLQHFLSSWEIDNNSFVEKKFHRTLSTKIVSNVNKWAESVSDEDLKLFMNTLFEIVETSGEDNLDEILSSPHKYFLDFAITYKNTEPSKRELIRINFLNALRGNDVSNAESLPAHTETE